MEKITNVIVSGVGGQGVITLASVIAEAALKQGYDVMTAEVHGLAMRFGHIDVHIRFGKKVHSSLVPDCEADLIISLEPIEALRVSRYAGKNTVIIFDTMKSIPVRMHLHKEQYPEIKAITAMLKKASKAVKAVNASEIVKKQTGSVVQSNIYLLGYAASQKAMPIKKEFLFQGMREVIPEKHFEVNKKIFESGFKHK